MISRLRFILNQAVVSSIMTGREATLIQALVEFHEGSESSFPYTLLDGEEIRVFTELMEEITS